MQIDADSKKRQLLQEWFDPFLQPYHIPFVIIGEKVNRNKVLDHISKLVEDCKGYSECIYTLFIEQNTGKIPVYIGKSNHPLKRQDSHLRSWSKEKGSYRKWSSLLLDTEKKAKYSLSLMIVPDYSIQRPVKGFQKQ